MKFRKLDLNDVLEVNTIRNYYIKTTNYIFRTTTKDYGDDLEFFEDMIARDYPCVVCIDEFDILQGFAYVSPFRSIDGYDKTVELSIYLKSELAHKGIGSALLSEVEKLCEDKFHCLVSVITSENKNSIKFHKKNGFNKVGELKECGFMKNQYIDVTFMQKILYKSH